MRAIKIMCFFGNLGLTSSNMGGLLQLQGICDQLEEQLLENRACFTKELGESIDFIKKCALKFKLSGDAEPFARASRQIF